MANIRKIEGKTGVSYKITVTSGRDSAGKQIRHYKTWTPDHGYSIGEVPDLTGLHGIHIEAKRCEQVRLSEWMAQAERDAAHFQDGAPAVFFRRSRSPWLVVMKLEDWIKLYRKGGCDDELLGN